MRRIFTISFILVSIIIATSVLVLKVGTGHADNTTFASGLWKGQGAFVNGQSGFPMTLTLTVTGTTFTGDLAEGTLGSEATINGSVSSTIGNTLGITFLPVQIISGNQIQLGSVYSATFSDGRISGVWTFQGHTVADGNYTLDPAAPVTPTVVPPQPPTNPVPQPPTNPNPQPPTNPNSQPPTNPAQQPPTNPNSQLPTNPAQQPPTNPNSQPPANQPNYVPSGDGQQATVTAALTWYGFDDNSNATEQQHNTAAISHSKNAGNPTLHNQATEGTGLFDDPITFAARADDQQTFPIGSVIYIPLTHKYYIMEDTCGDTNAQGCQNGTHHVDLWMGPSSSSGSALADCENKNTPSDAVQVITNPSPSLPVDITPEFSNGQCSLQTF